MGASAEILSASLGILAYARGVRRKDCGSAEDVLLCSAEVSKREARKQVVNSLLATFGGWRGVATKRHLNEGAAG